MTFRAKHISLSFQLGQGDFGEAGQDTIDYAGLRVSAIIQTGGAGTMSEAGLRVWGMSLDVMNRLSILGNTRISPTVRANIVTIYAFQEDENPREVFQGTISEAWIDAKGAPDISFNISAFDGLITSLRPVAPLSFRGSADAADIAAAIAGSMGLTLENSGVSVQLNSPYFPGTAKSQLDALARAAGFEYVIDGPILAIWPQTGRRGRGGALISRDTGLVGYPEYSENGLEATVAFNPNIKVGEAIEVESAIARVNGSWKLYGVTHEIEAELPGGKWLTHLNGRILDFEPSS